MAMIRSRWVVDRRKHHISTIQNVLALSTLSNTQHPLSFKTEDKESSFLPVLDSARLIARHKHPPSILQGKTGFISFSTSLTVRITGGSPEKPKSCQAARHVGGGRCWGEGYRAEERISPLYSVSLCICVSLTLNQLLT